MPETYSTAQNSQRPVSTKIVSYISPSCIERACHREVVQYRGQIMPLIRLSEVLGGRGKSRDLDQEGDSMQVIVYSERRRSVGLVVSQILDIIATPYQTRQNAKSDGLFGSAIIQQRVTELLDVPGLIKSVAPDFFDMSTIQAGL